jgi:RNA polymerase-binding transcription factor DksA
MNKENLSNNYLSPEYIRGMEQWLMNKRASKLVILKEGGERAVLHSLYDITQIDFALKRIKSNRYGICSDCGIPIEQGRLEAIPETSICSECARAQYH